MIHRPHVLIVEDDTDIAESLRDILEAEGYDVTRAANGVQALLVLDGVREGRPFPHVIVLDLMMPVMDGRTFRRQQLQRHAGVAEIPVIGWTAFDARDVDFPVVTKGGGSLDKLLGHIRDKAGPGVTEPRRPRISTKRLGLLAAIVAGLAAIAKALADIIHPPKKG